MVDADQLVGAAEIAHRLRAARPQVVYTWRRRDPDFPQPVWSGRMGSLWLWPDVREWAQATGRLRPGDVWFV